MAGPGIFFSSRRRLAAWRSLALAVRAGLQNAGILLSVLLGLAPAVVLLSSLVIQLFGYDLGWLRELDPIVKASGTLVATLVYLLLSTVVAGWFALRSLPPERYSLVVTTGRSEEEVLEHLARRSARLCRIFVSATRNSARRLEWQTEQDETRKQPPRPARWLPLLPRYGFVLTSAAIRRRWQRWRSRDGSSRARREPRDAAIRATPLARAWPAHAREIGRVERWIEHLHRLYEREIERIEAVKLRASADYDLSSRLLCDHLLQFSPAMLFDRTRKYLRNWREIRSTLERPGAALPDDPKDTTVRRLAELLRENALLEKDCASRATILDQLFECRYLAELLLRIAAGRSTSGSIRAYADALRQLAIHLRPRRWSRVPQERIDRAVHFLHRKQRAHGGYDLHRLLIRVCQKAHRVLEADPAHAAPGDGSGPRLPEIVERQIRVLERVARDDRAVISPEDLATLEHLDVSVTIAFGASRDEMVRAGSSAANAWLASPNPAGGDDYLVAHGYSKTVRDLLRQLLLEPRPNRPPVRSLLIGDATSELDTRLMHWELGRDDVLRGRYISGPVELLLGVVRKEDRVLVLMGAEAFDRRRRVLHPRGAEQRWSKVLYGLAARQVRCLAMVVAESYKLHRKGLADAVFSTAHCERTEIFDPRVVDLVVTEASRLEDIRTVIEERSCWSSRHGVAATVV